MKRFRYPLDPILKQYEWEIDTLKGELATLNQALNSRTVEWTRLNDTVRAAEQELLNMFRESAIIARDRKAIVEIYLQDQRRRADEEQQEITRLRGMIDGVFLQLGKKKQAQRGIEKHRERKKKDFDAEWVRQDALSADELWLAKLAALK
jgi:flagellar biosynthesis chaperone FliJ